ncbi:MAG: tetratricopeptide repeat protein [Anaerolineae bacterium]|nr:tetratricopeptide repeat protein [Anaerolineae bacterium]MBT7075573.1 tetratricopeptide repeat protein [Anaerolineae bacterium]
MISPDSNTDYLEYFLRSSNRFARFYHDYIIKYETNFEQVDLEYDNILLTLNIFLTARELPSVASTLIALDLYCDVRGHWQTLRHWIEIILEQRDSIKDRQTLSILILSLADIYSSQGDRELALQFYNDVINAESKSKNLDILTQAYFGVGGLYANIGKLEEAMQAWQEARSCATKSKNNVALAMVDYFTAYYSNHENNKKKHSIIKFVTDTFTAIGESGETASLMLRATLFLSENKDAKAQPLFEKALRLFRESGEKQGEALTLYNLGILAQNKNHLDEAFRLYQESLDIAKQLNDQTGLAGIYYSLGFLHLQRNEFRQARTYLDYCVEIIRRDGDRKLLSEKLYWLGYALANSEKIEKALQVFIECQEISKELGTLDTLNPEKEINTLRSIKNMQTDPKSE